MIGWVETLWPPAVLLHSANPAEAVAHRAGALNSKHVGKTMENHSVNISPSGSLGHANAPLPTATRSTASRFLRKTSETGWKAFLAA